MKKTIWTLILLLAILLIAISASADTLVLPASLKEIEDEAFMGDTSIAEVVLPEGLEKIGKKAFANSSVNKIYMPSSITYIAEDAFSSCLVICYGPGSSQIKGIDGLFSSQDITASGTCGSEMEWAIVNNQLIIFGSGNMDNYKPGESPWYEMRNDIMKLSCSGDIKTIGDYAFYNCENIENANLSNGIVCIKTNAFALCKSLKTIILPDSIEELMDSVFYGCNSLTHVNYPKNWKIKTAYTAYGTVNYLQNYSPFANCEKLKSIIVPEGV